MHYAALRGNVEAIRAVHELNPDLIHQRDDIGQTVIHAVIKGKNEESVLMVLNELKEYRYYEQFKNLFRRPITFLGNYLFG